jgi:DNA repair exonuclease SbcCD nuclease subunit
LRRISIVLFCLQTLAGCTLMFRLVGQKPGTWRTMADTLFLPDTSIRFGVLGDWGREGKMHQRSTADGLAAAMKNFGGQFMVSTGDNFYPAGVKSVKDIQWLTSYELIYHQPSLQKPWYVAPGNHDHIHGVQPQIDYTATSHRWVMPGPYFQLHVRAQSRMGRAVEADFFFVDTSPFETGYYGGHQFYRHNVRKQDTTAQMRWLTSALAGSKAANKIVVGHHPLQSAGERHGKTHDAMRVLGPLLQQHGVQLYLCGHEHHLELSRLPGNGAYHFISGAGSELRRVRRPEAALFSAAESGFGLVEINAGGWRARVLNAAGKELFVVGK